MLHGFAPSAPAVAVLSETVGIERQPPHGVGFDQFQKRRSAILRLAEKARDADVNFIPDIAAGTPRVFKSFIGHNEADQALDRAALFLSLMPAMRDGPELGTDSRYGVPW